MKLVNRIKENKGNNKGFSLVELIIVIAIMAILVGIVGTQVIPYINRSRVAKDQQILSALLTDGTSAFSMNAEKAGTDTTIILNRDTGTNDFVIAGTADVTVKNTFCELNNVDSGVWAATSKVTLSLSSTAGKTIDTITIKYSDTTGVVSLETDATNSDTDNTDNADLYGSGHALTSSK